MSLRKCKHEEITYWDDDCRGECDKCGATCDWHWEKDFDDLLGREIEVRAPTEWHDKDED